MNASNEELKEWVMSPCNDEPRGHIVEENRINFQQSAGKRERVYRIHHDVDNDRVNHKHSSQSLLILMLDFHFRPLKIPYSS